MRVQWWPGAPSAHNQSAKWCLVTSSRSRWTCLTLSHIVTHSCRKVYEICVQTNRNECAWNCIRHDMSSEMRIWDVPWSFESCVACMDALCCCRPQSPNEFAKLPCYVLFWTSTSRSDGLLATLRMASNRTGRLLYKQWAGQEQCQNDWNWHRKRNCAKDD